MVQRQKIIYSKATNGELILRYSWYINNSKESQVNLTGNVRTNKASTLFQDANSKKLAVITGKSDKEQFKLSKFKSIDPKINTNLKSN